MFTGSGDDDAWRVAPTNVVTAAAHGSAITHQVSATLEQNTPFKFLLLVIPCWIVAAGEWWEVGPE